MKIMILNKDGTADTYYGNEIRVNRSEDMIDIYTTNDISPSALEAHDVNMVLVVLEEDANAKPNE